MFQNYLFPKKYEQIGWIIFIPSAIVGLYWLFIGLEPSFLDATMYSLIQENIFSDSKSDFIKDNLINEIIGVLLIIGLIFIAFSKEEIEDEYVKQLRLSSLVWAVYFNYAVLLCTMFLLYGLSYVYVLIFNMFTILIFFIVRFKWMLYSISQVQKDEK